MRRCLQVSTCLYLQTPTHNACIMRSCCLHSTTFRPKKYIKHASLLRLPLACSLRAPCMRSVCQVHTLVCDVHTLAASAARLLSLARERERATCMRSVCQVHTLARLLSRSRSLLSLSLSLSLSICLYYMYIYVYIYII
jgi:hypothetical protein